MTKPNVVQKQAVTPVILFGMDSGKPRAGVFRGPDIEPALKAAQLLKLSVIKAESESARKLSGQLPPGRITAKGEHIVPLIRGELFERLSALSEPGPNSAGDGSPEKSQSNSPSSSKPGKRLPANWDDIRVGDLVLTQSKDPADGWWLATVMEKAGETCKLRYAGDGRGRPIQKQRLALALMYSGQDLPGSTAKDAKSADHPTYPKNWAAIAPGHTVLAKEEGPMQQFWEAKVISQKGDVFTLGWRDFPELPEIVRPRHALALVNPNIAPR